MRYTGLQWSVVLRDNRVVAEFSLDVVPSITGCPCVCPAAQSLRWDLYNLWPPILIFPPPRVHTILMNLENIDTPLEEAAEYLLLLHPVHSILGWRRCFWSDEERISIRGSSRPNIWDQISNTIVRPSNNPNIHPPSFIYSTLQTELSIISSAKSYFPVLGV